MQDDRADLSNRYRAIRRVLIVVLGVDLLLAGSKGLYGYLTDSLGMLSDGFHSAFVIFLPWGRLIKWYRRQRDITN